MADAIDDITTDLASKKPRLTAPLEGWLIGRMVRKNSELRAPLKELVTTFFDNANDALVRMVLEHATNAVNNKRSDLHKAVKAAAGGQGSGGAVGDVTADITAGGSVFTATLDKLTAFVTAAAPADPLVVALAAQTRAALLAELDNPASPVRQKIIALGGPGPGSNPGNLPTTADTPPLAVALVAAWTAALTTIRDEALAHAAVATGSRKVQLTNAANNCDVQLRLLAAHTLATFTALFGQSGGPARLKQLAEDVAASSAVIIANTRGTIGPGRTIP
jgi:hypothetical protein